MASRLGRSTWRLGWDLLREMDRSGSVLEGTCFSPLSVLVALIMLGGGSEAPERAVLFSRLGLGDDSDVHVSTAVASLLPPFQTVQKGKDDDDALTMASAVVTDRDVSLNIDYVDFLDNLKVQYSSYPSLAAAFEEINAWISDHTRDLVRDMLTESQLRHAHLILITAIAFRGTWKTKFDKAQTVEDYPFRTTNEKTCGVKMMMMRNQRVSTYKGSNYTAVELPYTETRSAGGNASNRSMVAYLPDRDVDMQRFLSDSTASLGPAEVEFTNVKYHEFGFPRFDLEGNLSLLDILPRLDIPIFHSYPRMAPGENQVSDIVHRAVIRVDEEGTEAAAATAVVLSRSITPQRNVLVFDRPFVFSIVQQDLDMAVFTGLFTGVFSRA